MDTASVGTLSSAGHIGVEDRYDPKSRWPFESIAKHATQAPARSLSVLSVAKTWRVVSTAVPTAGGEGLKHPPLSAVAVPTPTPGSEASVKRSARKVHSVK